MLSNAELDLLAWDVSDAFAKDGHPLDLSLDDIRPHLAEFIAKCQATAAGRDVDDSEPGPDAARSVPQPADVPEPPRYEPPRMGRRRVFTRYSFNVWGTREGETPTASVTDYHKRGEDWARRTVLAAVHARFTDAPDLWLAGMTKDAERYQLLSGQSFEIPADADEVAIY